MQLFATFSDDRGSVKWLFLLLHMEVLVVISTSFSIADCQFDAGYGCYLLYNRVRLCNLLIFLMTKL
jgi:hypothetical protein